MTERQYDTLAGRTALVTGAGRGIGAAIAHALHVRGANVALIDVDAAALQEAVMNIAGADGPNRCLATTADITNAAEVREAVERTAGHFHGLDIVVNNAGICPLSPFEEIGEEEWDRVLAVNLKGAFLVCQAALPYLRRSGPRGRIINIASVAGQMGGVLVGVHYAASKAGLIALSKSLAKSLAPDRVTVNAIAPGTTDTALTAIWQDDLREQVRSQIPLRRFGDAREIAAAVCFLASDDAAFITGATIDINGGLLMR